MQGKMGKKEDRSGDYEDWWRRGSEISQRFMRLVLPCSVVCSEGEAMLIVRPIDVDEAIQGVESSVLLQTERWMSNAWVESNLFWLLIATRSKS
jgi:hypothetical protein